GWPLPCYPPRSPIFNSATRPRRRAIFAHVCAHRFRRRQKRSASEEAAAAAVAQPRRSPQAPPACQPECRAIFLPRLLAQQQSGRWARHEAGSRWGAHRGGGDGFPVRRPGARRAIRGRGSARGTLISCRSGTSDSPALCEVARALIPQHGKTPDRASHPRSVGLFPRRPTMSRGLPLEESNIRKARPAVYLYRAAAAHVRSHSAKPTPTGAARELLGQDPVTDTILRSATTQATIGSPTWAGALARTSIDDSIAAITSVSAAAGLIARGMKLDFAGTAQIKIPGHLVDSTDAGGWVAEGAAIKVRNQRITAGATLQPRKLMVITTYTREMAASSNLEAISRSLITEATSLALDKAMFSTVADDGVTPGGILHNATSVSPTTGGGLTAMAGDIDKLIGALVNLGAGRDPVFITSPQQAAAIRLQASPLFTYPVLQSSALPLGTVI